MRNMEITKGKKLIGTDKDNRNTKILYFFITFIFFAFLYNFPIFYLRNWGGGEPHT